MLTTLALAGPHWAGAGFGWLWLFVPLIWIGVFVLIFILVGRRWRRGWGEHPYGPWNDGSRSAEATLGDRYARGDVDETEYRARLEVLRANRTPPPR
ncbi:MAG: hypothetical protein ABI275_06965 [Terrimesophilobacter sp.]